MSTFPGATVPHRAIQQIDLVPTLALMLGLPIPYNNLGSVVPELFWDDLEGRRFNRALELNAAQVERYLHTYRASPHGSDISPEDSLSASKPLEFRFHWSNVVNLQNKTIHGENITTHVDI